uniref:DEK-C domain-containing protein n=1 Tax=Arundo donax TaxID=35708 RepID=A0A0A9D786_ARUDO
MEADAGAGGAAREREAEIEKAMRARVADFKKQADSLTLEGVRRALEKDLGLEMYSLDAHKKFIKQCVDKVFSGSEDENINNNASEKAEGKDDHLSKEGSEDAQPIPASDKMSCADQQVVRSSETEKDPDGGKDQASGTHISEDLIKDAIDKRASYFRENSETLTLQGVRRTLEEDLKLEKKALDAYKKFVTTELDRVLQEPANGTTKSSKKGSRKDADQKASKGSKRAHDSLSEMEDSDEDARPRKRRTEKGKVMKRQKKSYK